MKEQLKTHNLASAKYLRNFNPSTIKDYFITFKKFAQKGFGEFGLLTGADTQGAPKTFYSGSADRRGSFPPAKSPPGPFFIRTCRSDLL